MKKLLLTSLITAMLLVMVGVGSANADGCTPGSVCTFGSITITDIQFNEDDSVVVDPSESVDVKVTVAATIASSPYDPSNDWKSTKYMIEGGSWVCVNTPNHESVGNYAETFVITAPANAGVYDFKAIAYKMEGCTDGSSNTYTATDAITVIEPYCQLVVDDPFEAGYYHGGEAYFDSEAVPIEWHLEGNACTPIDIFYLFYQKDGMCNPNTGAWYFIPGTASGLTQGQVEVDPYQYFYSWNRPMESGKYCLKLKVTSNGAIGVSDYFNVDLAPPVVSLEVGDNHFGECGAHEEGDCYVNTDTPITVTCSDDNPDEPWQSGVNNMRYRYRINDGEWTQWFETEGTFQFNEDSQHELQYECYDNVGKHDEGTKTFIVDSVAPEFVEKTIGEPQYCEGEECDMYVTQNTQICITYEDPLPHPVGNVQVYCDATVRETLESQPFNVRIVADENGCFTFGEDSYHSVHCWGEDALGNRDEKEDIYEQDIVDTQTPITTLNWMGPHYVTEGAQWINTVSRISLSAYDPEPHPVGLYKTYYRYEQVNDDYCWGELKWVPTSKDDESWMEYGEEFGLPESCHVIEYYSEDLLGNSENVHVELVFSDHTTPEITLDVDSPGKNCDNVFVSCEPEWDWKVVKGNPITLSCEDQGDHPSGVDKVCWKLDWDGDDMTSKRCGNGYMEDGYCCQDTSEVNLDIFYEECVHTLEYKCVDNVGKYDEGITVFKVEGTPFTLNLDKKWNLISFPFNLLSSNVEEVFSEIEGADLEIIWSYEDGEWKSYSPEIGGDLEEVVPGRGYWVKMSDDASIMLGGDLFSEGNFLPNAINLDKGWNLIGHYGLMPKQAYCSLFSLVDTQEGHPRWSSLWGYDSSSDNFLPLNSWSLTTPGKGYWLEMDVADYYSPSTTCWGLPQMPI